MGKCLYLPLFIHNWQLIETLSAENYTKPWLARKKHITRIFATQSPLPCIWAWGFRYGRWVGGCEEYREMWCACVVQVVVEKWWDSNHGIQCSEFSGIQWIQWHFSAVNSVNSVAFSAVNSVAFSEVNSVNSVALSAVKRKACWTERGLGVAHVSEPNGCKTFFFYFQESWSGSPLMYMLYGSPLTCSWFQWISHKTQLAGQSEVLGDSGSWSSCSTTCKQQSNSVNALLTDHQFTADHQLSGVQAGPMWLFRDDFPSCSGSAEIWHVYSLCVKKCPCVLFFKNAEKYGQNCVKFTPSLPSVRLQKT